jgi:type IV secretion system protein VirB10
MKALVRQNVYDTATGHYLLIPQGSRIVGKYSSEVAYGQDGVQVIWSRIIFPDGSSIDLGGMPGLDSQGNAGFRQKVDRHYRRTFGMAILTTVFQLPFDLAQRRQNTGSNGMYPSAGDTASATVSRELSQTGAQITRRNMNVQPTIRVEAGYQFNVRVQQDILFPGPYEPYSSEQPAAKPRMVSR